MRVQLVGSDFMGIVTVGGRTFHFIAVLGEDSTPRLQESLLDTGCSVPLNRPARRNTGGSSLFRDVDHVVVCHPVDELVLRIDTGSCRHLIDQDFEGLLLLGELLPAPFGPSRPNMQLPTVRERFLSALTPLG
jgi:hypothetical protein